MTDEADKDKNLLGRMSGTDAAWSVEVRLKDGSKSLTYGELILTDKWQTLPVAQGTPDSPHYIPSPRSFVGVAEHYGLMSYPVAQAIRWQFHCHYIANRPGFGDYGLETRLVSHRIKYSHEVIVGDAHDLSTYPHGSSAERKPPVLTEEPGETP